VTLVDPLDSQTAIYSNTAIVTDSSDGVHIGYRIFDSSSPDLLFNLKYASNIGSVWNISLVDGAGYVHTHLPVSIALNSSEGVYIGYSTMEDGNWSIRLAEGGPPSWNITEVSSGEPLATMPIGTMCLDSQGYAHFCLGIKVGYTTMLGYATNRGGSWSTEIIDGTNDTYYACITVDSADYAHILFTNATKWSLHYATNAGSAWTTQLVDASGRYGAAAFDSLGTLYVVYTVEDCLKLAWLSGGLWSNYTVDSGSIGLMSSMWPSIAIDSENDIHLCYSVGTLESASLMYAHRSGSDWTKTVIEQFDSSLIPDLGCSSITTDSQGYVHIAYVRGLHSGHDSGGGLKYATNAASAIPEMNAAMVAPCLLAVTGLVLLLRWRSVGNQDPSKRP
jgi:hypothetical protein